MKTKKINISNFYKNKKPFKIEGTDINNILDRFIRYNDDDAIGPLCVRLPQMIGYVKCFDSNKKMSFKVTDKKLLKKLYGDKVNKNFQGKKIPKENASGAAI